MEYSKEQKTAYFRGLREQWAAVKKALDEKKITDIKAIILEHGLNVSPMSYFFVSVQIKALGWAGIPYLDYKTFKGWKDRGFQVMRGEKSKIKGLTWIRPETKNAAGVVMDDDDAPLFPKEYHLFGRHQVEAIGAAQKIAA